MSRTIEIFDDDGGGDPQNNVTVIIDNIPADIIGKADLKLNTDGDIVRLDWLQGYIYEDYHDIIINGYAPTSANDAIAVLTAIASAISTDIYKLWAAAVTQVAIGTPTADIIFKNSFTYPVVWSYTNVGRYTGTLTGAFLVDTVANTTGSVVDASGVFYWSIERVNDNSVLLSIKDAAGNYYNGRLNKTLIEIKVKV